MVISANNGRLDQIDLLVSLRQVFTNGVKSYRDEGLLIHRRVWKGGMNLFYKHCYKVKLKTVCDHVGQNQREETGSQGQNKC